MNTSTNDSSMCVYVCTVQLNGDAADFFPELWGSLGVQGTNLSVIQLEPEPDQLA